MTIPICYHFGTYCNFKEYYQNCICGCFHKEFPHAVSYNRFVELMPRVFCKMMLFMKLYAFGKCTGITFVDSTMIPVCHNVRRYFNKVFSGLAKNGYATTLEGISIRSFRGSPRTEKGRWVGVMALNFICFAMIQAK